MKRMCKRLLALALCLMMLPMALAEGKLSATPTPGTTPVPTPRPAAASVLPDLGWEMFIRTAAQVGDAVYILTYYGKVAYLWRYEEGLGYAQRVGDDMLYAHHHVSMDEARQNAADYTGNPEDAAFAVSTIFSDGKTLYGYNGLNHTVFTIEETAEGLRCNAVVSLAQIGGNYTPMMPTAALVAGDWLLWYDYDYRMYQYGERLLAFNLKTGAVKQAVLPENIKAISSYKDGKVLVVCAYEQDVAQRTVYAYDPETDATEKLGSLPKGVSTRRIAYSEQLGMMVYQDKTRIMGWTPQGTEQLGYIPATNSYAELFVAGDTLFFTTDSESLQSAELCRGYAAERSITMLGGTMYTVLSQFYNRYQDVPVYYTERKSGETWQETLARTEDMPDMCLWTDMGAYAEAVKSGALMDLSVYPEICAYSETLYPAFRELAEQNGGVYGVPVYAASYGGWYINKEVMNAMGLTEADIPANLEDLIAFAQKWNDEWAEKYPHFTLLNDTTNYRERFYYAIENEWRQLHEKDGKAVIYDDPTYLSLLEKLDAADFTKIDAALEQTDPEVSEYKQALIWTGVKDVGNFDTYMEDYSDRIFIPLTLTADTPYVTPVLECSLWVVNARSENGEYCAALLAEAIEKLADKTAYTLRVDKTEPVENEGYAEQLAYQLEYLAQLEASADQSVNKDAALRLVAEQKAYIENGLNGRRYFINPSAIENYRSVIAPAMYVNVTAYDAPDDMDALERRYLRRELTAQELVDALTK